MGKLYLMGCVFTISFLFIHQKSSAQDTAVIKVKDSTISKSVDTVDDKQMDALQKSLDSLLAPVKSYFQAGLTYLSNNVYLGRKDTVTTPYITATVGYYHKSGLYLNTSVSYLPNSSPGRIDLVTIEGGYNIKAGKFEGQASADKFFFSSQSNNVKADLKGGIAFFAGYDLGFIKPTLTPMLNISDKLDFTLTMGIEHAFYSDDNAFDITPTFNVNGSTQNYYNSYYRDRKFKVKKKKVTVVEKGTVSGEVLNASQFKILDYEFTIPVNYTYKKFTFNFTPTYAIPVNPAVVSVTRQIANEAPITKTGNEKLSNSFFWEAGIIYKFK
jgi:hypothetical protein